MTPPGPSGGENAKGRARDRSLEPLPPLVSAALEPGRPSLEARLERIGARGRERRYTVLGEVARGGMGRILRAWDEDLAREVAMKVVPRELGPDASEDERADHERALARFVDEARITGQLDHPGIPPVYEIGLDGSGAVFFTMPLVRGRTLKEAFDLVQRGEGGWTLHRVLDVMHRVALTLAFAHAKGVVHRDLKPENIMVGRFGETYVMDWGLALLLGRSAREGIVGTPAYMSPEQAAARTQDVGPRSDVYSLGAILYELFARRMPHELSLATGMRGDSSFERVLAEPPRPLRELGLDLPPELAAIADKAMARRPEDRYPGALELADDLAAWLAGRVVSAHETGALGRLRKWRRRNRALATALDGLVGLLAVGAAAFLLRERSFLREVEARHRAALVSGYAANLSAADLGLRAHETSEAKRRLEACDESLRGWEWRHLALRSDPSLRVLAGHASEVRAVAVSPDGLRLATGSDDAAVLLWDAPAGQVLFRLEGHEDVVMDVAFDASGSRLASASRDDTLRVWNTGTGILELVLDTHDADVLSLAFSRDGRVLASGDKQGTLVLSDSRTGSPLAIHRLEKSDALASLAFLAGAEQFVAAHVSGQVRCWDVAGDAPARERSVGTSTLQALEADPQGERLAVGLERTALVLDARTLEPELALSGHLGAVSGLSFSPDGTRLASASNDNVVRVFELATGRTLAEFDGHDRDVNEVVFFPDGRGLASVSEDDSLRLWDLERTSVLVLEGHQDWVAALAFSPDGTRLVSGSRDRSQRMWDARTGAQLAQIETAGIVDCVAWSARDELAFGCGDPVLRLAPAAAPAAWRQLPPGRGFPKTELFDASGTRLLWRDSEGIVSALDLERDALLFRVDTEDEFTYCLALAPDGASFAAGTGTGDIGLWDARTGAHLGNLREGPGGITALAFSPDGEALAAGRPDGTVVLFSVRSRSVATVIGGHERLVSCLAFSPDGTRLVSGSFDQTLRIWSLEGAEILLTLHGHADEVTAVAFDAAGEVLASASKDRTIRLWRTARAFEPER